MKLACEGKGTGMMIPIDFKCIFMQAHFIDEVRYVFKKQSSLAGDRSV